MKPSAIFWTTSSCLLGAVLVSNNAGRLPGSTNARVMPSCGSCHASAPGGNSVAIHCVPSARSLALNQAITVNSYTSGGATDPKNWGGMTTYATAGRFTAGTNTRTGTSGSDLTHSTQVNNRNWTYGYTAPATPGLVQMYVVGLTADGNGNDDAGDLWAFHGADPASTVSTPLRLYANADGVVAIGEACAGSWGQVPVLGAKESPAVGNANFAIEAHGTAPSTQTVMLLGANPNWVPVDLGFMGVPGCKLFVEPLMTFPGQASAGDAKRAEGVLIQPLPIPNDPGMVGGRVQLQVAIVDLNNGRPTPLTLTNALGITIR
jgi:hypothetical protein